MKRRAFVAATGSALAARTLALTQTDTVRATASRENVMTSQMSPIAAELPEGAVRTLETRLSG